MREHGVSRDNNSQDAQSYHLEEVPYERVHIDGSFWKGRLETLRTVTVRHVFDRFEDTDGGAFRNFDRVKDDEHGSHYGKPWFDGLVYESICGASKLLTVEKDEELAARLDGYIKRIAAAQDVDPDGYLNTYTTLLFPEKRWGENGGNLRRQHDLYNAGCLVEAAVHHYRATGRTSLLDVALRFADYICSYMGPAPRKEIVPAHSLPEDAFVELYRLFQDNRSLRISYPEVNPEQYLELAHFWIERRGHHEHRPNSVPNLQEYAQDHLPLLEQTEAAGHAVRATLLYAGMTYVARETGDHRYLGVSRKLWEDVTMRKMHVTGGVGAMHEEEMFGPAYYLPNNAYLETCAAVGLAWWANRMGPAFMDASYANVFEHALYNNVLAGLSLDGKRFFYQNPLESKGDHHRWDWHGCPCCPPMLLKLLGGLAGCLYLLGDSRIIVNHYVGNTANIELCDQPVTLRQETSYPWDGSVRIEVDAPEPTELEIDLRIPDWCRNFSISVNGKPIAAQEAPASGYVAITRTWNSGDLIELDLAMPITLVEANPYVEAARGCVAIRRGPIVYCIEGADNTDVSAIRLGDDPKLTSEFLPDLLGGIEVIRGVDLQGRAFTAIPYFAWDNRSEAGPNPMKVWIPRDGAWSPQLQVWTDGDYPASWDDSLYRICWTSEA